MRKPDTTVFVVLPTLRTIAAATLDDEGFARALLAEIGEALRDMFRQIPDDPRHPPLNRDIAAWLHGRAIVFRDASSGSDELLVPVSGRMLASLEPLQDRVITEDSDAIA